MKNIYNLLILFYVLIALVNPYELYTTYAELCGDRPVYESAAESTEEESTAAEEGSSETVEESEVTTGTSP
jgi:hypothetical protein